MRIIKRFINYVWANRKYNRLLTELEYESNPEKRKQKLLKAVDFGNKWDIDPTAKYL